MGPRSQLQARLGLGGSLSLDSGSRSGRLPALGIAAAIIIAIGAQAIALNRTEELTPTLVAARDLEDGTILTREDVRIELVPVGSLAKGSLDLGEEPVGAVLTNDVVRGEQLSTDVIPGTVLSGRISEKETATAAPPALVSTRLVVSAREAQTIRPGASIRVVVTSPTSLDETGSSSSGSQGTAKSIVGASGGGVAAPKGDAVERPSEPSGPLALSTPDPEPEPLPNTRARETPPSKPSAPAEKMKKAPTPTSAPPSKPQGTTPATPTAPTAPTAPSMPAAPTMPAPPAAPAPPSKPQGTTPATPATPAGPAGPAAPQAAVSPQPSTKPAKTPSPKPAKTPKATAPAQAKGGLPQLVATPPVGHVVVSDAKIVAVETPASPNDEISVIIETPRDSVPALVRFSAEEDLGVEVIKEAPPTPTPSPSPTGGTGGTQIAPSTSDAE